jgi:hypothetical protein
MTLSDLIPTLQLSIGPVILISGVGLLVLSMTNRFGRIIDRSRILAREVTAAAEADRPSMLAQLRILSRRAKIVRAGIGLAALSVLLASVLIISLFLAALLDLAIAILIATIFMLCMLALIGSLVFFLVDIDLSLRALWLEMPEGGRTDV